MIDPVLLTSRALAQDQSADEASRDRPLTRQEIIDALSGAPPGDAIDVPELLDGLPTWTCRTGTGRYAGSVILVTVEEHDAHCDVLLAVDPDGRIVAVHADDAAVSDVFNEVVGLDRASAHECATWAGVVTEALLEGLDTLRSRTQ